MEKGRYSWLKEKERAGTITDYELRQLNIEDGIRYERYINSLIDKVNLTEEEEKELQGWSDDMEKYDHMISRGGH